MEKDDIIKSTPTTNEKYGVPLNARVEYSMASKITKEAKDLGMTLSNFLSIIIATGWGSWSGETKEESYKANHKACIDLLMNSETFRLKFRSEVKRQFWAKVGVKMDDELDHVLNQTFDSFNKTTKTV